MLEITRLYDSAENAERAAARLRWEGFTDDLITLTPPIGLERRWKVSIRPPFGMVESRPKPWIGSARSSRASFMSGNAAWSSS
jgi:hypothetical protein